jgi:hypothetical protein
LHTSGVLLLLLLLLVGWRLLLLLLTLLLLRLRKGVVLRPSWGCLCSSCLVPTRSGTSFSIPFSSII